MEAPSPARLYAAAVGALLVVLGIVGFFYHASFGELDRYEEALGALQVNGWLNLFYLAIGGLGLLVAGVSSRAYCLAVGLLFTLLAIVDWGTGSLHLVLGLLGLAAAAGTPRSKPRAKPARQRA
ncbi:MAG TPA: DUF4383 domain-containing protein [Solirubrobacterales bacterium]|jgi:hypothetical protein